MGEADLYVESLDCSAEVASVVLDSMIAAGIQPPLEALATWVSSPRPDVRRSLARYLGSCGDGRSESLLLILASRGERLGRRLAVRALGRRGTANALPSLQAMSRSRFSGASLRRVAGEALAQLEARLAEDPAGGQLSLGECGRLSLSRHADPS